MPVRVIEGDITSLAVDAVVNAANERLLGGSGVDGAIHRVAGPQLLAACRALPELRPGVRCPTGEARITPGFGLPARYVIHTVGPVWRGGRDGEPALLAACHRSSLALAAGHGLASVAFPAISCGAYGYPVDDAAQVAVASVLAWLREHAAALEVTFCCFGPATRQAFARQLPQAPAGRGR